MLYTYQRRKALNKAVREMYPDMRFEEYTNGVPVMVCHSLPQDAVRIVDTDEFMQRITSHCSKTGHNGVLIPDHSKTLPVFIRSMELTGEGSKQKELFYRVNYVSISESSLQRAEEYIGEGKLYAAMPTKESNP